VIVAVNQACKIVNVAIASMTHGTLDAQAGEQRADVVMLS
jgi:hypothetical protein